MNAGLYVHVPFCARLCPYCDFYKRLGGEDLQERWVRSLLREAQIRGGAFSGCVFDSVYLGGGTPSHLGANRIRRLLRGLREVLPIQAGAEWTVEANPESAREDVLFAARSEGANRVSLGLQSLDDRELVLLGRLHDAQGAREAVGRARAAGFENLSLDLIYGLPRDAGGQGAWEESLRGVIALVPEHISCYLLTLEPEVPLAGAVRRGEVRLPDEETQLAEYAMARELLAAAGYERYEISNWTRSDLRCRHNENVWTGGIYLGLGPGAHGFDGTSRRANRPDLVRYLEALEAGIDPPHDIETLDQWAREEEQLFLGLRRRDGVSWEDLTDLLGPDRSARLRGRVAQLTDPGYLVDDGTNLRIGDRGLFVSNALVADLLEWI
jgi:oxygen-independent coproporphyrinogen III oxidase